MSLKQPSSIPQTNPKAGYLAHKAEIDESVARVLNSGWYILGQEVEYFENEFAAYIGTSHAIGVANGTDALVLALWAGGIGPNDLVFTVSHTAVATVAAIELVGATPVFVDIDPAYHTMDPNHLEEQVKIYVNGKGSLRPAAIIPVHLYGQPADMPAILEIANRYNLLTIEDCAQAHGARLNDQMIGTCGDLATFSFYPTKNLGAFGDGGMVITSQPELAEKVHMLRQYGWQSRYVSEITGTNSRLDELQTAVLHTKLNYLDQENDARRQLAKAYAAQLAETDLILPATRPNAVHVWHQYVVQTPKRDALRAYLAEHHIGTGIHYPVPVHLQPAYRGRLGDLGMLPRTEQIAKEILSLPMYPYLEHEQLEIVTKAIKAWDITKQ
ncbi:MAG: DegT/DnrJ/EryC1/StrS family aminotransferase [Chloroflexi bacterium]|nr:MAG: DegT/DnrJ/EryC1/StrS family aminotransferase [Chloroflexota bacterium]